MTTNEPHTPHSPDRPSPAASRVPVVLVSDDDPVQLSVLTTVLERAGFGVVRASNGLSALELAALSRPDLLIVDALMPGLDGFDTIAAIRKRPGLATTPAMVLSGLEDVASRVRAFAIGADDFVTKPVDPVELIARVRAHLRVVEAWHGRVTDVVADLRSVRRSIGEQDFAATPLELARGLVDSFPRRLGCSTLIVRDDDGETTWIDHPSEGSAGQLAELPDLEGTSIMVTGTSGDRCPVCARMGAGQLLLADAGAWTGGRAVLAVGCTDRDLAERRIVAEEVADACRSTVHERLRGRAAELETSRWLRDVIDRRAFDVYVQRIVDVASGRIVALEALARFDDGTPPGEVFGAASRLALHTELELALVETAVERTGGYQEEVRLHVNVSPATAITGELQRIIAGARRPVALEISEHALFSAENASALRAALPASCLLAADDVGVGYAGLAQLLEYRPEIVKIDRSLVTGIDTDPARQALVAGLVTFARVTESVIIGEGVERSEEWLALRELGVELGQGYYFGRPGPIPTPRARVAMASS